MIDDSENVFFIVRVLHFCYLMSNSCILRLSREKYDKNDEEEDEECENLYHEPSI